MNHTGAPYSVRNALRAVFEERLLATSSRIGHPAQRRAFHEYFVTHLPSSSLSPDKQPGGSHHRLPRNESQPHSQGSSRRSAANLPQSSRDTTIVRIPIKNAKHHFGAGVSRGSRPYNEDTYQAGTIEIPAFAKRQPISVSRRAGGASIEESGVTNLAAKSESGDPQVFYFGVYDGHGGAECSAFLRDRLHGYVEEAALLFGMESTLKPSTSADVDVDDADSEGGVMGAQDAEDLQKSLVSTWKETVGGYFKRFKPDYFPAITNKSGSDSRGETVQSNSIETILTYAFLKADLDFTTAQAHKHTEKKPTAQPPSDDDPVLSDRPLNDNDVLFHPERPASQNLRARAKLSSTPDLTAPIGGTTRFKGGSTASVALIATPTPTPFWHPASPSTLIAAHVGDTRILLCRSSDGKAVPLTTNHHPSAPVEATRLRRYAASFVTDSFGEERVLGLANTRAFGDIASKRIGVSAEPQLTKIDLPAAGYSFLVLMSDGVSGHLDDQEIVDVVKEAKTPADAANALVSFAVEVSEDADNATALVVRLGGWERRNEGGGGSLGTKERRLWRRNEAMNPRSRR
ncbi:Protein phosphatase 2C 6 [Vermiconidia calcicola]|uniref:Protein phosphatase 2C 6 n=1 Tax=Vermiconidia calcicola TaxID=1690605 RepID=A0ACC3NYU9_9PEZI|nr:Protein phosphatase 2C 6 [Vermiconidia calcicola]